MAAPGPEIIERVKRTIRFQFQFKELDEPGVEMWFDNITETVVVAVETELLESRVQHSELLTYSHPKTWWDAFKIHFHLDRWLGVEMEHVDVAQVVHNIKVCPHKKMSHINESTVETESDIGDGEGSGS